MQIQNVHPKDLKATNDEGKQRETSRSKEATKGSRLSNAKRREEADFEGGTEATTERQEASTMEKKTRRESQLQWIPEV